MFKIRYNGTNAFGFFAVALFGIALYLSLVLGLIGGTLLLVKVLFF